MRRIFHAVWPMVLWMAVVFVMSTDLGSASHTGRFLGPVLRWFVPDITPEAIARAHFLVRKGGHLTEYAILALLVLRGIRVLRDEHYRRWSWGAALGALAASALYASTDEFHQRFVGSRGASIHDVMIDCVGALCGVLIAFVWWRSRRQFTSTEPAAAAA